MANCVVHVAGLHRRAARMAAPTMTSCRTAPNEQLEEDLRTLDENQEDNTQKPKSNLHFAIHSLTLNPPKFTFNNNINNISQCLIVIIISWKQ